MKIIKIESCGECPNKDYVDSSEKEWFCGPLSQEYIYIRNLSDIKDQTKILDNCPLEDYGH